MEQNSALHIPPVVVASADNLDSPVTDSDLHGIYTEILDDIRSDRNEINSLLNSVVEMVLNEGDSSSASKEAVVNLIKVKSDLADKKTKIADLMTTLRLKDKAISKVTANQTNHIHITDKRNLIESLTKYKKEKKEITNGEVGCYR